MQYAIDKYGKRAQAIKGERGTCPGCGECVIAKAGVIVIPHWAHLAGSDCDPWFEPETAWHRSWKKWVSEDNAEYVIKSDADTHRADIFTYDETIIELQHSSITGAEILARNAFYKRTGKRFVWLFDATPFKANLRFRRCDVDRYRFDWSWARKSHYLAQQGAELFWDFGNGHIGKVLSFKSERCRGGFIQVVTMAGFLQEVVGDTLAGVDDIGWSSAPYPAEFAPRTWRRGDDSYLWIDKPLGSILAWSKSREWWERLAENNRWDEDDPEFMEGPDDSLDDSMAQAGPATPAPLTSDTSDAHGKRGAGSPSAP